MKLALRSSSSIRRASSLRLACAIGIVAAIPIASAGPARAQPQVTATAASTARDLFRKAAKEYKAGQVNEAYRDYLAAWNIQQSPDTAGNLGAVELELGYLREAAEHAAFAIAHFPPSGSRDQRAELVSVLTEACKQIGILTIQANVPGAAISIDGRPIGRAPLDGDVYIEPGDHTIVAEAPDHDPAQQKVHVEKGSRAPVSLTLAVHTATGPQPTPPPTNWPRPIAVAGFATAGAGYAVGIALAIMAKIKATDANQLGQSIDSATHSDPGGCLPGHAGPAGQCASLESALQSEGTFASTALWMFVGATAVTAGTIVYTFVVPRYAAPPATTGMTVVPVVTPSGGAIVVQGKF